MSGIVGLNYLDGQPVDRDTLASMISTIEHRGPDGASMWSDNHVGLGHLMLCTTPESVEERQPYVSLDGNLALTADARIDNRAEMIDQLDMGPSVSDSELIMAAYQKWGMACPEKLLGDFAFALWDLREKRIFCARDHLGVKPFYYYYRPGRLFAFGSEVKAILSLEEVPRTVDELRIAYYLAREADDASLTFFKEVRSLPPAHALVLNGDDALHLNRYWSPDPEASLPAQSDHSYSEGFREVFTEAVRCRLRSTTQSGVLLSGGLDSSAVACVARDLLHEDQKGPIHTISAVFPDLPADLLKLSDERHFVQSIIHQEGKAPIDAHEIPLSASSPLTNLKRTLWHLDAPYLASNLYLSSAMFHAAGKQGIRSVLDGAEGDIVVSHGVEYLSELAYKGRWNQFADVATAYVNRSGGSPNVWFQNTGKWFLSNRFEERRYGIFLKGAQILAKRFNVPYSYILWHCSIKPSVPRSLRQLLRNRTLSKRSGIPALIAPHFAKRINYKEQARVLNDRHIPKSHTAREAHWMSFDAGAGSIAAILAESNHVAASYGVEERHPFYDPRLVSYCLALPHEQKLHDGWTRMILRRSMENILPHLIQWRIDKADLSPNFYRNFLHMERPYIEKLVSDDVDILSPYVNMETLQKAIEREHSDTLWLACLLSQWLQQSGSLKKPEPQTKKEHTITIL